MQTNTPREEEIEHNYGCCRHTDIKKLLAQERAATEQRMREEKMKAIEEFIYEFSEELREKAPKVLMINGDWMLRYMTEKKQELSEAKG